MSTDPEYSLIVGDLEPPMPITITMNDEEEPLSGALSIQLEWLKPGEVEPVLVDLTAVDLDAGLLERVWVDGDTARPGTHKGRVVVTRANGKAQHFSNNGEWFTWPVIV